MTTADDILAHYGIKGMRWGVRRSQAQLDLIDSHTGHRTPIRYNPKKATVERNADGSLKITASSAREHRKIQKQIDRHPSQDHQNASAAMAKAKKGGTKSLSNKELQDLITRMNLEKQYSQVVPPSGKSKALKAGGKFAGDVLVNVGKQQATKVLNDQATKVVAQVLKK